MHCFLSFSADVLLVCVFVLEASACAAQRVGGHGNHYRGDEERTTTPHANVVDLVRRASPEIQKIACVNWKYAQSQMAVAH